MEIFLSFIIIHASAHGIDPEPCFTQSETDVLHCLADVLIEETDHAGPEAATKLLTKLKNDPRWENTVNDHQLAHLIGRMTARQIGKTGDVFLRCPKDFAYGCQHGFFEELLSSEDSALDAARAICDSLTSRGDERVRDAFFCSHGIGHGLMMAKQNSLKESLAVCDALHSLEGRQGCRQGVFMEHVNAFAREEIAADAFGINPITFCERFPERHHWACAMNIATPLLHAFENSWQKATDACGAAGKPIREACAWNLGQIAADARHQERTQVLWDRDISVPQNLSQEKTSTLCNAFPAPLQQLCMSGAAEQLLNHDRSADALTLCTMTAADMQASCFSTIGNILIAQGWSEERRRTFCSNLPEAGRAACALGDGGSFTAPEPNAEWFAPIRRILRWLLGMHP